MINRRILDSLRVNIPEAQKFIYPDASKRISGESLTSIGADVANTLFNIPKAPSALGRLTDQIGGMIYRKPATSGMHNSYLNNKYGAKGWDLYKTKGGGTGYNPAYEYVDQDFGNGVTNVVRENTKFAGEALSDEWMNDVKIYGEAQDSLEEVVELARQRQNVSDVHGTLEASAFLDPKNPSVTTEQQVSRQMLYGDVPDVFPPDRILGKDLSNSGLGIDGPVKDDSEYRVGTNARMSGDMLVINRDMFGTEVLSPSGVDTVHASWGKALDENKELYDRAGTLAKNEYWIPGIKGMPDKSTEAFNKAAGEYYGQQALRLQGAQPVKDADRSHGSQMQAMYDSAMKNSTIGTNRLVEASVGLSDIPNQFKGDYLYDDNGTKVVADYQTRGQNGDNNISFNLAKSSKFKRGDEKRFEKMLVEAVEITNGDLDRALNILSEAGELGTITSGRKESIESGFRPGKFFADSPSMSVWNDPQDRIEEVVFGKSKNGKIGTKYGMLPDDIEIFKGSDFRETMGAALLEDSQLPGKLYIDEIGGINLVAPTAGTSSVTPEQRAILSQEYGFPKVKRERAPASSSNPAFGKGKRRTRPSADYPVNLGGTLSAQERHEARQLMLQRQFGGPRVGTPIFDRRKVFEETTIPRTDV